LRESTSSGIAPTERAEEGWPSPRRAWYALAVLTVGLLFATIDRSVLQLLVEPIKADLKLTDTQMSFIIGFAFVFFYAFLGLPIARLADRSSRRLIIGLGIAFWSVMTALCGLAQSYWQLFWARVGVGAGESSFAPATFSVLTDSFPPRQLPRALAINSMGFMYGTGLALIVGGAVVQAVEGMPHLVLPIVGEIRPWQVVFFAVGLPGLLLAALMATVHEPPRRGRIAAVAGAKPQSVPIKDIWNFLRTDGATFGPIFLAMGIKTFLSFGAGQWTAAFFMRTYGWSIPQVGYVQGLLLLIVSPLGLLAGSWLAERYARRGYEDANMRVVLIATVAVIPTSILFPLMPTAESALAVSGLNLFLAMLGVAPGNAALQIVTPNEMRGQVRAAYQFIFNVIGYAAGPIFVALLTDYLFEDEADLRYSLTTSAAVLAPIAALVTWYGLKPYGRSVVRARAWA
jgi:MFS family permease